MRTRAGITMMSVTRMISVTLSAALVACSVQNVPGRLQDMKCLEAVKEVCVCYWQDNVYGQASGTVKHYEEMSCTSARLAGFRVERVEFQRGGIVE